MLQMQLSTSLHSLGTKNKIKRVDEREKRQKTHFYFFIFYCYNQTSNEKVLFSIYCNCCTVKGKHFLLLLKV